MSRRNAYGLKRGRRAKRLGIPMPIVLSTAVWTETVRQVSILTIFNRCWVQG